VTISGSTVCHADNPLRWRLDGWLVAGAEEEVHRPEEALDCFLRTDMDVLAMGPLLLRKARGGTASEATGAC
jgi:hypothetical protein